MKGFDPELALPRLDREAREWLASALQIVHPRHRWLQHVVPQPSKPSCLDGHFTEP